LSDASFRLERYFFSKNILEDLLANEDVLLWGLTANTDGADQVTVLPDG
jgi:hypothetical protein